MSGGGEEKAVFHALKADVEKTLPKIAEKQAGVVDDAVEKGTRNLADHVATEEELSASFRSAMPKEEPVAVPKPTAAPAEAAVPGTSRIARALDSGPAPVVPRLGRDALHDSPDFNTQIDHELNARGLDRAEHDRLRTTPTNELPDEQLQQVVDVRNSIRISDGQVVTKVLKQDVYEAYMKNADTLGTRDFDPTEFGGSIARGTDTAALTTPSELRDALALDDHGAVPSWSPIPEGAEQAYQLRLHAPKDLQAETTYGAPGTDAAAAQHVADLAGSSSPGRPWNAPFLGTGYTGGGIPEWDAAYGKLPNGAEIWKMTPDGREALVGHYDGKKWTPHHG